jgi:cell wall-associated NlpC family hydrolase
MKNRHLIIPIASMVAVSLAFNPVHAQTTGPSAPADASAPPSSSGPILAPVAPAPPAPARAHTMSYTVAAGDSLTKLAVKFNTTRKKLKDLNDLATTKLKPGQIILVPAPAPKSAVASAAKTRVKHHSYLAAQPVQDFDIPASTFASCPVPVPTGSNDDDPDLVSPDGKPAPVAALVSPSEMAADQARQQQQAATADDRLTPTLAPPRLALPPAMKLATLKPIPARAKAPAKPAPSGLASEPPRTTSPLSRFWSSLTNPSLTSQVGMNTPADSPSNDWGFKFLQQARALGDRGIEYDDDWRPPGERTSWTMDCSNTTRWLYKSVAGINLPRTASDQYYYLHLQGKAWDVPTGPTGWADVNYLQRNLKPGDLLFWENTYRPERQPPITHVMVFLGTNARGQWIMAGSQSSHGGEHNRSNGGPDVYVFRPSQPCGGYSSWFGLGRHVGRFCAFGRPLEADPSKFALDN